MLRRNLSLSSPFILAISCLLMSCHGSSTDTSQSTASCSDLSVGDTRTVSNFQFSSDAPVADYMLSRLPDVSGKPHYQISVNFWFIAKDVDDAQVEQLRSRTQQCFRTISPLQVGKSGTLFSFHLTDWDNNEPGPELVSVNVLSKMTRDDYVDWDAQIDCPTIIHETLHHTGLVDLYHETGIGIMGRDDYYTNHPEMAPFDCRTLGPMDSVMNEPSSLFIGYEATDIERLHCLNTDPNYEACRSFLSDLNTPPNIDVVRKMYKTSSDYVQLDPSGNLMLYGFSRSRENPSSSTPAPQPLCGPDWSNPQDPCRVALSVFPTIDEDFLKKAALGVHRPDGSYIFSTQLHASLSGKPALTDGEVRAIVHPQCSSENAVYYTCGSQAYTTSAAHGGEGCASGIPAVCSNGLFNWLN